MKNSTWSFVLCFVCAGGFYLDGGVFITPLAIFAAAHLICKTIEDK